MFNPDNINDDIFNLYLRLIGLLKRKGATKEKYSELTDILLLFYQEKDNLNVDELKILKNVLIIAEGILYKAHPKQKKYITARENCFAIYSLLKK